VRRRSALTAVLIGAALWAAIASAGAPSAGAQAPITAAVGSTPLGQPLAPGFVGVSLEYSALHLYTGRDPNAVNPVLLHLIGALSQGDPPVIRIGGNSADATWWPMRRVIPPGGVSYALTPGWLRTTHALAAALGARMIMDINLAAGRPALAATEARAILRGIGRQYVAALEVGNEPDLYSQFTWYRDRHGRVFHARGASYGPMQFISDFSRWRAALPAVALAGPATAQLTWLSGLQQFISAEPTLGMVTIHRYPLRAGVQDPSSPLYPSILNLLGDQSSSAIAQAVAPYVAQAHAAGLPFRVDEINSASHSGQAGVSNTFASALWVLDTLFNLASVGVDGVNVHSLPHARYELFSFSHPRHHPWSAFVHPEYYGMLMFSEAFPTGAQLLPVTAPAGPVKVWATTAPLIGSDSTVTRVVLINKDVASAHDVQVQIPGAGTAPASLEWLQAPSVTSTTGVTLGAQSFGAATKSGNLANPQARAVSSSGGVYSITLPPASAVLLTQ
jgi:Glycosyl hydrolase family 79 C-terminal beta domain